MPKPEWSRHFGGIRLLNHYLRSPQLRSRHNLPRSNGMLINMNGWFCMANWRRSKYAIHWSYRIVKELPLSGAFTWPFLLPGNLHTPNSCGLSISKLRELRAGKLSKLHSIHHQSASRNIPKTHEFRHKISMNKLKPLPPPQNMSPKNAKTKLPKVWKKVLLIHSVQGTWNVDFQRWKRHHHQLYD